MATTFCRNLMNIEPEYVWKALDEKSFDAFVACRLCLANFRQIFFVYIWLNHRFMIHFLPTKKIIRIRIFSVILHWLLPRSVFFLLVSLRKIFLLGEIGEKFGTIRSVTHGSIRSFSCRSCFTSNTHGSRRWKKSSMENLLPNVMNEVFHIRLNQLNCRNLFKGIDRIHLEIFDQVNTW